MNVAIVGAGLIGAKRAISVLHNKDKVSIIADLDINKATNLSKKIAGSTPTGKLEDILYDKSIQAVIVSTTHNNLANIVFQALKNGKHVLSEKPLGISSKEVASCVSMAKNKKLVYKAGYNHRFHPGILMAKKLLDAGKIGKIMYIKGAYGHGGRPGYEKEWRMNKKISGGGEAIDQGAHLIDLMLWFYGKVPQKITGFPKTLFWNIKVEDNIFILFEDKNFVANLHAGWTEWKNKFCFEIYGTKGYLLINGLGGSYGNESLTFGLRVPGKAPKEKVWTFPSPDDSWSKEWKDFKKSISKKGKVGASGIDGLKVLKIIEDIYKNHIYKNQKS